MPLPVFKRALQAAGISQVLVTSYGLKDSITLAFPGGIGASPTVAIATHAHWIRECIRHSPGSRFDVGVVWNHANRAPLFSRPGNDPSGMRQFPVHVLLQATSKILRYLRATPTDPLAASMPPGGWLAGNFHVPATFLRRPKSAALLRGAAISSASGGDFYDKGVLLHPMSIFMPGLGRSGVSSVVLYNNRVKHAAKAVEPEREFEKMGWDGDRASRSWVRELDMLDKSASTLRSFSVAQFGGIRAEAKVVIEGGNYPFDRAVLDGVKAALFAGNTTGSGICLNASISKQVSDKLFAVSLALANMRRGQPDLGLYVQNAVNQLGYHVLTASQSRDFVFGGEPIRRLLVPWRAATATRLATAQAVQAATMLQQVTNYQRAAAAAAGSSSSSSSSSSAASSSSSLHPEVAGFFRNLPAQHHADALGLFSLQTSLERLGNVEARGRFSHPSAVSTLDYHPAGLGPDFATYCTSVAVPSDGSPQSRTLAVGSYAQACYSLEIHQAFLWIANEQATRIPEARVRVLGFERGEATKTYRIVTARGLDSTRSDRSPGPDAIAIATSQTAKLLVWVHFDAMSRITAQQLSAIPMKKADVTALVRTEYVNSGLAAAREFYKFREAVVCFIRCRHIVQQATRGRAISEVFLFRGGGGSGNVGLTVASPPPAARRAAAPTSPLTPRPVAALLQRVPSPLNGPIARRLRKSLARRLGGLALGTSARAEEEEEEEEEESYATGCSGAERQHESDSESDTRGSAKGGGGNGTRRVMAV
jgi:hypothetical protein